MSSRRSLPPVSAHTRWALAVVSLGAWLSACAAPEERAVEPDAAEMADGGVTPERDARVELEDAGDPGTDAGDAIDAGSEPLLDAGSDAGPSGPTTYVNPVLEESGDPFCARFGGLYHLYLPDQVRRDGAIVGGRVVAFTSRDLVHWDSAGAVFDNIDESYGGAQTIGLWAPEVLEHGGRYYLYYVNVMSGALDDRVGDKDVVVIESDDPLDFRGGTRRTVLLDDDYAFIDPSPFEDPATGQLYLLFKRRGEYGSGTDIRIRPMSSPFAFDGPATILLESERVPDSHQILEHPMLRRAGGVYFLLFSKGDGAGTTYSIAYATAGRPTGPYDASRVLVDTDAAGGDPTRRVISPGAASIVRDGAGETWMVYRQKTTLEHTFAGRAVTIDPIEIDPAARTIRGTATRGRRRPAPTPLP